MSESTPDRNPGHRRRSTAARPLLACAVALATMAVALAANARQPAEVDRGAAAVGGSLFRAYCASCHGTRAVGDGEVAEYLNVKPADLTQISARNEGSFPFEQVVKIIDGREKVKGHGHGEMPVWGDALKIAGGGATEQQARRKIEQLAHYLWSIQK